MAETAKKRGSIRAPPTNAWTPGVSRNPGGRPRTLGEARKALYERGAVETYVDTVLDLMRPEQPPNVRLGAAHECADRLWGRAEQALTVTHTDGVLEGATADERAEVLKRQAQALLDAVRAERATIVTSAVSEPVPTPDRASEAASGPQNAIPEAP